MNTITQITKAISDNNRVRVVMALTTQDELCACHIVDLLGVTAATVSRHMGILSAAGFVESRKSGKWTYYRLNDDTTPGVSGMISWLKEFLKDDYTILADKAALPGCICRRATD